MTDKLGPVSTLPGSVHELPVGATCDEHPDRKAVVCIQGETDSFGADFAYMCEECRQADIAYKRSEEASSGTCDWCKMEVTTLAYTRDYEEGTNGPVYKVCKPCRDRRDQREDPDYFS